MRADAPAWAVWLESSELGIALKQSALAYPLINTAHVVGIALIAGAIVALDLRLLGAARRIPADAAERLLRGVALAGLFLALPSGVLLFIPDAITLSGSATFGIKLLLVAAGIANAVLFVLLWRRRMGDWDSDPPVFGRVQAVASIAVWIGAVSAGRLIAYF
jgi:hypothetical protein